eukprot:UN02497
MAHEVVVSVAAWSQWILAIAMFIGSFMHLDSRLGGDNWCENTSDDYNCIGDSLVWDEGDTPVSDNNEKWRETFTFRPTLFLDTWTPFFLVFSLWFKCFQQFKADSLSVRGEDVLVYLFGTFWAISDMLETGVYSGASQLLYLWVHCCYF